jgi:hypothetical protein
MMTLRNAPIVQLNASIEVKARRTVTLRVDDMVRGEGVLTAEFELPDAEFAS